MKRISTVVVLAFLFTILALTTAPVYAQDVTDVVVPTITERYAVPITVGDVTGVLTITVKGSDLLSITTDLTDTDLGDFARLPSPTHTVEVSGSLAALIDVPEFAAGEPDEVDVVEMQVHPYDDTWDTTSVDVIIRNNTDETVGPLTLAAEAYSADGEYLGEGSNTFMLFPKMLESGQLTFGEVVFRGIELLDTDTVQVTIDDSWEAGSLVPLAIDSWKHSSRAGKSITGTLTNPWDFDVNIDSVHLLCFDDERIPQNAFMGSGETPAESLEPGESAPFQFNSDCDSFIISATGSH